MTDQLVMEGDAVAEIASPHTRIPVLLSFAEIAVIREALEEYQVPGRRLGDYERLASLRSMFSEVVGE